MVDASAAAEGADIEGQKPDFVEVRAGRSVLSKDYGKLKRISLPIVIEQRAFSLRNAPVAAMLLVSSTIGAMVKHPRHPWIGVGLASMACMSILLLVRVVARQMIGAGTISIEADGFRDTRMGPDLIPWAACERSWWRVDRLDGTVPEILLNMRTDAVLPLLSRAYRWAFLLARKRRQPVLVIELQGSGNTIELARVVDQLIKKHARAS